MKVIIVSELKKFIFATFKLVGPGLKNFNNSKNFCIVSFILSLGKHHFFRKISFLFPLAKIGPSSNFKLSSILLKVKSYLTRS